jgi:pSer/pThr/pTyr-binding forkhead associated (FHA) protein
MAITFHHALDRARPRLVTVMGPQPNREYALTGTITVGRLPGNTIVTADGDVSRHHAEIYMSGDTPIIHDLASLNGTRVNGQFVPGEQALQNGDTISIGNLLLVFQMGPDAVGPLQETRAMQVRDVR